MVVIFNGFTRSRYLEKGGLVPYYCISEGESSSWFYCAAIGESYSSPYSIIEAEESLGVLPNLVCIVFITDVWLSYA